MIKKILITLLTIANLFSVAASAATEVDIMQNDVSFVSADYGDLNILTVKDGKKIAVNGGFAFSFYSSSAVTAQMEISMVGLTSGREDNERKRSCYDNCCKQGCNPCNNNSRCL